MHFYMSFSSVLAIIASLLVVGTLYDECIHRPREQKAAEIGSTITNGHIIALKENSPLLDRKDDKRSQAGMQNFH